MTKSTNEKTHSQNAVPSISIKIKNPNSYQRREEEDVKSSRVHETLEDERVNAYKNKFSLDRKFKDRSVFDHDVASSTGNLVKTRTPSKSKKLNEEDHVKSSRVHEMLLEDERVRFHKEKFSLDRKFSDRSVFDHDVASSTTNLMRTRNPSKSKKLKEENVKSSRVHETLEDERVNVNKNKFSTVRKSNDQSVFDHEFASSTSNLVKNRAPSQSKKLKEDDMKSSKVHETLEDGRVDKFSLDRKSNDQSLFDHEFASGTANLAKTRTPSKSNKLTIKLKHQPERRDYHEGRDESKRELFLDHTVTWVAPANSAPTVNKGGHSHKREVPDLISSLPGWNVVDRKRGGLALKIAADVQECDEDVIEAAGTLMMMRSGLRPSMAESSGNKRCLGFDLNEPPPEDR